MTEHERDRNTALAVARGRARRGDEAAAERWLAIARGFAAPTRRQLDTYAAAILAGRRGNVIPGQIDLDGRTH